MAFATGKALLWGAIFTIGMIAALALLRSDIGLSFVLLQGVGTGALCGLAAGWLMREVRVDLPGQSVEQIESSLGSTWQLRGLDRTDGDGGIVCFSRGRGILTDRLRVTPTATGVTIQGPANMIRAIERRAAV